MAFEAAMRGYNKLHMYRCSVEIHQRMILSGIGLNPGSYYGIVKAYTELKDFEKAVELFHEYKNMCFGTSVYSDKICTLVIKAFCKLGKASEARECLEDMKREKVPVTASLYASLISCFAGERHISAVEELLDEAESEQNLPRDPEMFLKVVMMYIDQGLLDKAFAIIDRMVNAKIRVPDCILCAIISGFSKKRGYHAGVRAYEDMHERGCQPGQVTYASAINAYYQVSLYTKAEETFAEMETRGYDKCVVAYSSMISMYSKLGRISDAMRLMAKMKSRGCPPNVWIYNTLMEMHGKTKDLKKVEKLWTEMKRKKITPDKVSFTTLISAYNKAGEYDKCMEYYVEFRTGDGSIDRVMAGIMVGVLSKCNRFDELIKLLRDMNSEGVKFDGRLFVSAMNALRDAGLGSQAKWLKESIAVTEFQQDPQDQTT
ncbi:hypothetical protein MLD38_003825 [Melastoma candidum]|nr:hypothetical protein MLD38_003825 [Melastoma candidum]